MLLSKLKNLQGRIKPTDEDQCFHLDEEENQAALEAKKQLEAFSQQQAYNEISDQPIRATSKKCTWDNFLKNSMKKSNETNIRDSSVTKASEHDEKTLTCRPSNRTERKKYTSRCNKHSKTEVHQQTNNQAQNDRPEENNSIWLQQNLNQINNGQKSTLSHYFTKLEFYKKHNHTKSNLVCQTFRSYSLKPTESQGFKPHRILTSRRKKSSCLFTLPDDFQNVSKPYSFNETLFGVKTYRSSQKSSRMSNNNKCKILFEEEPKVRPATSRQSLSKIQLRPQFMKLIFSIKEKEELKLRKKMMPVKGRKSSN